MRFDSKNTKWIYSVSEAKQLLSKGYKFERRNGDLWYLIKGDKQVRVLRTVAEFMKAGG